MKRFVFVLFFALLAPLAAAAVEPDEILADPVLEARARDISKKLRCVVCQNQDIDSSNAGVARDLRLLVRERLVAGDADEDAIEYIVARYGAFVLLKPPFKPETYALWFAAPVFALFAFSLGGILIWRSRKRPAAFLSEEEEQLVAQLIARQKGESGS